jgi:nitrogen fixation/metabolism regulation signal transduction histidine kinase
MKPAASAAHGVDHRRNDVTPPPDMRANRYEVVSRVADDLAHEIKNPLNAIVVNLEVLRRKVAAGAADAVLERANVIDQEIMRVHTLVDQLLQLVRPPRTEPGAVSLDEALDELRPLLDVQAKTARVGFQMSTDSGLFAKIARDVLKFAVLNVIIAIYSAEAASESISIETRATDADAEIVIRSRAAVLGNGDVFLEHARALMESVDGKLEIAEPAGSGTGSTAVLRVAACSSFA